MSELPKSVANASITPTKILLRHFDNEILQVVMRSGTPLFSRARARVVLISDELSMPPKQSVADYNRIKLSKRLSAQVNRTHRKKTPLLVRKGYPSVLLQVLFENPVFGDEILYGRLVLLVDDTRETEKRHEPWLNNVHLMRIATQMRPRLR